MDILEHDFLLELFELQNKYNFYLRGELPIHISRVPENSHIECSVRGHSEFEMMPVHDSQASINNEQGKS